MCIRDRYCPLYISSPYAPTLLIYIILCLSFKFRFLWLLKTSFKVNNIIILAKTSTSVVLIKCDKVFQHWRSSPHGLNSKFEITIPCGTLEWYRVVKWRFMIPCCRATNNTVPVSEWWHTPSLDTVRLQNLNNLILYC